MTGPDALNGNRAATEEEIRIPLASATYDDDDLEEVIRVLRSGRLTMGDICSAFEGEFADYIGRKHAVLVNSGSSANLLAFFLLANPDLSDRPRRCRWFPGCEVIVPALTWATTVWPIVQAGAIPVFVDSDPLTLQMDPDRAAAAVTERTVAICPVHVMGNAVPMRGIEALCKANDLWLVEDSCEAVGTRHGGRRTGTFGDVATYSFFYAHHMTTIEGGMVVTDDDELADFLRAMRAHGWIRHMRHTADLEREFPDIDPRYMFVTQGFNVRSSEINAALGRAQLRKLDWMNQRRNEIAARLCVDLEKWIAQGFLSPMVVTDQTEAAWFGFPFLCASRELRDDLRSHLERNRIETRPIICGNMVRQPAMRRVPHRVHGALTGADSVMDRGLYIGTRPLMTEQEIRYVGATFGRFFSGRA